MTEPMTAHIDIFPELQALFSKLGLVGDRNLIKEIRIYPNMVEVIRFSTNQNGEKWINPDTGWIQTEAETFGVTT